MQTPVQHVTKITDLNATEVVELLRLARDIKANPTRYRTHLSRKTLLMLFEKPSLRTRVSFETGMTELGGHAIFYSTADSPLGKKESLEDTAKVLGRYVHAVMARVQTRHQISGLAKHSSVPVINGLDDFAHPCQILADLLTITEKKGVLKDLKLCYLGDVHNNVTYDLMRAGALLGLRVAVAGPVGHGFDVEQSVLDECAALCAASGGRVEVHQEPVAAIKDADIVYTDSWMSYHIPEQLKAQRVEMFSPFRVTSQLMSYAKRDAIFMNCLPAIRGMEQDADVIDGPQSVVFDQAENRLHAQKALLLHLMLGSQKPTVAPSRCVVALGGNAIKKPGEVGTTQEMLANVGVASRHMATMIRDGWDLAITHGNGPQVGDIFRQNQIAADQVPPLELSFCDAESEGLIGYMIQQSLGNELRRSHPPTEAGGAPPAVVSVISQTVVDDDDPAWQKPSKPVGKFYSEAEAKDLIARGKNLKEDAGRGWRVVVPSPKPKEIVEAAAIRCLVDHGHIVVASGGGGVPVVRSGTGSLSGRDAVVDKDLCAVVLAEAVSASLLMLLTDVDAVCLDWGKPSKRTVPRMTVTQAKQYISEGHFAPGSMLPKVQACVEFVEKSGHDAIITSLDLAVAGLSGDAGTRIVPDPTH